MIIVGDVAVDVIASVYRMGGWRLKLTSWRYVPLWQSLVIIIDY